MIAVISKAAIVPLLLLGIASLGAASPAPLSTIEADYGLHLELGPRSISHLSQHPISTSGCVYSATVSPACSSGVVVARDRGPELQLMSNLAFHRVKGVQAEQRDKPVVMASVPVPGALSLFLTGLVCAVVVTRRKLATHRREAISS